GDAEEALELYEQLRQLKPDSAEARRGLARAHAALGDEETAAAILADFVDTLGPTPSPGALTALAELAEELGDEARAAELRGRAAAQWAERAVALAPQLAATPALSERGRAAAPPEELRDLRGAGALAAAEAPASPEVLAAVRELFGYEGLRAGQARVIEQVLAGVDTLAIMPTGAGKSLCYQLAAMLLPGVTVVISPLIALMQDQVE